MKRGAKPVKVGKKKRASDWLSGGRGWRFPLAGGARLRRCVRIEKKKLERLKKEREKLERQRKRRRRRKRKKDL